MIPKTPLQRLADIAAGRGDTAIINISMPDADALLAEAGDPPAKGWTRGKNGVQVTGAVLKKLVANAGANDDEAAEKKAADKKAADKKEKAADKKAADKKAADKKAADK